MADIFVSYSRKDLSFARTLAAALSARGWSVWWDRDIPAGRTFDDVIAEALGSARCVIVVWSKDSVASSWVREEADEGRRRDILVPVLIDDVRPPLGFSRIQAADLRGWDGGNAGEGFEKLVGDIAALLGPPPSRPATVTPTAHAARVESPSAEAVPAADVVVAASTTAPPERPGRRTSSFQVLLQRRWKSAAAVIGAAAIAAGAYTFAGGNDGAHPRPITAAAPEPALRLDAILVDGGKPVPDGVAYEVFEAAQDAEGNRKSVGSSSIYAGPPKFVLPPGRYYVTATYGSASANTEVDVHQATLTLQMLNLRAGVIRPTALLADGAKPLPDQVSYAVDEAAADVEGNRRRLAESSSYSGPPRFVLPAGRYKVSAMHGSASATEDIEVTAGDNKAVPLNLRAGVLNVSARLSPGSPILKDGVAYDVHEAAADEEGNRKKIVSSSIYSGPPRLPLPAGRYYVTAAYGSATASAEKEVSAGAIEPLVMDLGAGVLSVAAVGNAGQPLADGVEYVVSEAARDADGNRKRVTSSSVYAGPPKFPLPAGSYVVSAVGKTGKAEAEVTIAAGEERRLELALRP